MLVALGLAVQRPAVGQPDASKRPVDPATNPTAKVPEKTPAKAPADTATKSPVKTPIDTAAKAAPVLPVLTNVRVTGVASTSMVDSAHVLAGIGDVITVHVHDLKSLVYRAKCQAIDATQVPGCTPQKIVLYLDGREIKEIYPESGAPKVDSGTLTFHLQRSLKSDEAWADLLGSPRVGPAFFRRPTPLSVGYESGFALDSDIVGDRFSLVRIREVRFWIAAIGLLVLITAMVQLAKRTNLLRDMGPSYPLAATPGATTSEKTGGPAPNLKPYSLARCQMAFWFVLTVGSFMFIYLITGASDTVTTSVLALIGISAGTFLGAAVIDAGAGAGTPAVVDAKVKALVKNAEVLENQRAAAERQAAEVASQIEALPAGTASPELEADHGRLTAEGQAMLIEQEDVRKTLDAFPAVVAPHATRHFLKDVLGESGDPSFHRFQIFVWTIVLGILFLIGVWSRLSMPEFSATLLGLMGISSGTYLGFKFPEAKT